MIILQHGWGFDHHTWDNWLEEIQQQDELMLANRGYFQQTPADYSLKEKLQTHTAIVHGFGLHLLPLRLLSALQKLVIISGFDEFHPQSYSERVQSERMVERMLKQIERSPSVVLQEYRRSAFYPLIPEEQSTRTFNTHLLFEDLSLLNRYKLRPHLLKKIPEIIILHGERDKLVPVRKAEYLHQLLPGSKLAINDEAGNMLPVTHQEWCLRTIYDKN